MRKRITLDAPAPALNPAPAPAFDYAPAETPAPVEIIPAPNAYLGGRIPLNARLVFCAPNPKVPRGAAYARYTRYPALGATVADILKVTGGPNTADLLYDVRKGFVRFE